MNILFVTTDDLRCNASHNIRNVSLIKAFANEGHRIFVLMEDSNKPIDNGLTSILEQSAHMCKPLRIIVSPVKKTYSKKNLKTFLARKYHAFFPIDPGVHKINKILKNAILPSSIDMIISSSDPISSHVLGYKMHKLYPQSVWFQYWGDIMSEDIQFGPVKHFFSRRIEKNIINGCDYAVYTNPIVADYVEKNNVSWKKKILWIPTPFETRKFSFAVNDKQMKVGYFGSYGSKQRSIYNVCKAALDGNFQMVVCGNGDGILPEGVVIKERCGSDKLEEEEKQCSVIVIAENKYIRLRDGSTGCLQVPGKLYHYANSPFYLLVTCEGDELKKYYEKYNRYIFCDNDVESIKRKLVEIREGKHKDMIHPVEAFSSKSIVSFLLSHVQNKEQNLSSKMEIE